MADTQSENPDVLTHSVPAPSEVETAECSSSHLNVETGNASPELDIDKDIDDLFKAAVEGKIDDFKKHGKHLVQLVTPNKNTILHIHITARPLDFVEGIPKLIHKLFPRAQQTRLFEKKWSLDFVIKKLFPDAQKTARLKKEGSLKFVEEILEMCPDLLWQVNIKDETLLHMAARHGHDDIVELLISKLKETHHNDQEKGVGAARQMLRMTNIAKDTALHEAVRFNHFDVVSKLIEEDSDYYSYGANVTGETPFYLAAERGYFNIVSTMSTKCSGLGPNGRTALHAAVLRNDLKMTRRILIQERTSAKTKDEVRWIPLHYAAYHGYIDIMKELLDNDKSTAYIKTGNEEKTDIKSDNEEKTALHIAASQGNVDIMKEIISRCPGCSELVDERGWNVLHFAMESRSPKAIKLVLENPSLSNLINEYNKDGNTPFHQFAALGLNMTFFIDHPKVDKLAFNEQNLNAIDITLEKDVSREQKHLMYWFKNKGFREGQRVKVNKDSCNSEAKCPSSDEKGKKKEGQRVKVNKDSCNSEAKCPSSDEKGKKKEGQRVKVNKDSCNSEAKCPSSDEKGKKKDGDLIANIDEAKGAHLVVATLIATVTFAAGFTVPGGYKNEGSQDQGTAMLTRSAAFRAFVITDTIAMMLSSSAVIFHLFMALDREKGRLLSHFIIELHFIFWATFSMVIAFVTGTYTILAPSSGLAITACVLGCLFFLLYLYFSLEFMFDFLDLLLEKVTSVRSWSFDVFREIRIVAILCQAVVRKVLSK